MRPVKLFAILTFGLVIAGCNASGNKTNIELIQNMMDQISNKAQDWDTQRGGEGSNRVPPAGTVPQNYQPYAYQYDPDGSSRLPNPLAGDMSVEVLKLGQQSYSVYCAVCHGDKGDGLGPVADKMLIRKPPSLLSPLIRGYKDGRIYHIIVAGQGVMGSYASQISNEKERWAIVNYIRQMQSNSPVK